MTTFEDRFALKNEQERVLAMTSAERAALVAVLQSDGRSVIIEDNEAATTLLRLDIIGGGKPVRNVYRVNHTRACMYGAYIPFSEQRRYER